MPVSACTIPSCIISVDQLNKELQMCPYVIVAELWGCIKGQFKINKEFVELLCRAESKNKNIKLEMSIIGPPKSVF